MNHVTSLRAVRTHLQEALDNPGIDGAGRRALAAQRLQGELCILALRGGFSAVVDAVQAALAKGLADHKLIAKALDAIDGELAVYEQATARGMPSTPAPSSGRRKGRGMPRAEANVAVGDYLKEHPDAKAREVREAVGCSLGMVTTLSAWKAVKGERAKGRKAKQRPLTEKVLKARAAPGDKSILDKLIAEQEADRKADEAKQREADERRHRTP